MNNVVPNADLQAEVRGWAEKIHLLWPTALEAPKQSFDVDFEHFAAIDHMAYSSLVLFGATEESKEGITAVNEERQFEQVTTMEGI